MRKAEASGWSIRDWSKARALRLSLVLLATGIVMASHPARAGDDDDDSPSFEQKIIGNIMRGIGGTNMEDSGIDYRERSPLVVPPTTDLPPPVSAKAEAPPPNWPKDPDVKRRKAEVAARKKENYQKPWEEARPLSANELNQGSKGPITASRSEDSVQPGLPPNQGNPMMSPSQLGFDKFTSIFHSKSTESKPFVAEPPRDNLTEPPPGYQTPSPNYAYGAGPEVPWNTKHFNIMTGKDE